jgi:transcription elongation factor GreA
MSDVVYLTPQRMRELQEEVMQLKTEERKDIAEKIAEARSYGDLSENAEYDAAKNAQALLESRIARLEQIIGRARVLNTENLPNDKIYILSIVTVHNHTLDKQQEYTMVSAEEADIEQGKLATTSPIGRALMGKTVGDVITVEVPAGTFKFEVIEHRR